MLLFEIDRCVREIGWRFEASFAQAAMSPNQACRMIGRKNAHLACKVGLPPREGIEASAYHYILAHAAPRRQLQAILRKPAPHRKQRAEYRRKQLLAATELGEDVRFGCLWYEINHYRVVQNERAVEHLVLCAPDRGAKQCLAGLSGQHDRHLHRKITLETIDRHVIKRSSIFGYRYNFLLERNEMPADTRIRRRLKLRDLDTLLAVAHHGSMAKAAAQLSVSQPAVSKAMADMERTLGVRLFDRTTQGVEPTLYGRAMLKWARAVFDDVRQGMNEIEFLADPATGELRVSAAESMLAGLLPAIVGQIHARYPLISIQVRPLGAIAQFHRDLRDRSVDLGLGRMAQSSEPDLDNEILFYDRTLVVAGLHNPWTRRRRIKLAELINEPWSLPPLDTVVGKLIEEAFRANGLNVPRRNIITPSMQLHGALMASGPYLAIFPSSALHFSGKRLALKTLAVDLGIPPWPTGITTLKNRTINPVARLFIECAHEVSKPLARRK